MIFVRIIDENGLFVRDDFVDELTEYTIETPCQDGFYLPKWDGTQWIEGGTPPTTTEQPPTDLVTQLISGLSTATTLSQIRSLATQLKEVTENNV